MNICRTCTRQDVCKISQFDEFCLNYDKKPLTNADKIRAMSDEELAEWIAYSTSCVTCPVKGTTAYECRNSDCVTAWWMWLKSTVEENT